MLRIKLVVLCLSLFLTNYGMASAVKSPRWFQPIMALPKPAITTFRCIIHAESTSTFAHPNLGDNNADGGSSGIFQIEPILWNAWAPKVGLHMAVWRATPYQQALAAVEIWRHDQFSQWADDGCV